VTSPVERHYRNVLRLLPAGYRANWEEDMVTAYMESTPTERAKVGERLSVVWLALRLRLNGSHTSPRVMVGYRAVHAIALIALLYQAIAATTSVASGVFFVVRYHADSWRLVDGYTLWFPLFSLLWIAAFACFVWNWFVAARILVLLGGASAIGLAVAIRVVMGDAGAAIAVSDVSRWAWLAVSVVVVFVTPSDARALRPLWAGAYAVGSGLAVVAYLRPYFAEPGPMNSSWWVHLRDTVEVVSVGLLVAMVVVLATTRSAQWLLALALMAGGLNGVRLLSSLLRPWPVGRPSHVVQADVLSAVVLLVAVVCVAVGLLRWRRVPAR
jgi:hypothetical protein